MKQLKHKDLGGRKKEEFSMKRYDLCAISSFVTVPPQSSLPTLVLDSLA